MRMVVVGGSGRVGAKLVENLRRRGHDVMAAAEAAHVKHHIVLSIVGTDRLLESGYFRAKMRQEDLARESMIPHTSLRSTQFFEFAISAQSSVKTPSLRMKTQSSAWDASLTG